MDGQLLRAGAPIQQQLHQLIRQRNKYYGDDHSYNDSSSSTVALCLRGGDEWLQQAASTVATSPPAPNRSRPYSSSRGSSQQGRDGGCGGEPVTPIDDDSERRAFSTAPVGSKAYAYQPPSKQWLMVVTRGETERL